MENVFMLHLVGSATLRRETRVSFCHWRVL